MAYVPFILLLLAGLCAAYQIALTGVTYREKQACVAAGSIAGQVSRAAHRYRKAF